MIFRVSELRVIVRVEPEPAAGLPQTLHVDIAPRRRPACQWIYDDVYWQLAVRRFESCRGHKIMTSRNPYRGWSWASTSVAALLRTPCSRAFEQVRRVQVRHTVTPGYAHGDAKLTLKGPVSADFLVLSSHARSFLGSV